MASGLLIDYLGSGVIADRPASLTLFAASLGVWFSTDTGVLSVWDGSSWSDIGGGGSGDVVGPASSVDLTLPRYDGTTGKLLQGSGVTLTDSDEISGYRGNVRLETGTTYTLDVAGTDTDSGRIIDHANAAPITVTLPNSAPVGFCVTYVQSGAGQVTFSPASGASLRNRQSHTKTAGQWAETTLYVRSNSGGSSAEYVLGGDTAS